MMSGEKDIWVSTQVCQKLHPLRVKPAEQDRRGRGGRLLLQMCQRNLGKQLEVDDHVQAAVQQKERGGLSSGQDLADDGDVLQEEGLGLAIRLQPVAYWKLAP